MTRQEVIELIDQFIYANANNEITANTLNPVLDAIVNQSNDLIGDITQLTTSDTDNLVAAINSILNDVQLENGNTVKVWRGQQNPNTVSPPDSKEADFYIQTSADDQSLVLWQYFNGYWRNNDPVEPDRFIQLSTIDLSSNIVYVNPVFKWIIGGLPNSNEDVRDFPISPAGTGESRIDILIALPNDSIIKREGIPSAGSGTAVSPAYAEGQGELLLTTISIYEDNISEPVNPTLGRYVTYSSYQFTTVFSETDNYIAPNEGKSSYEIKQIGGTRTLLGISGSFLSTPSNEDFVSEGKPIVIFNNSGESAVLKNNASIGSDYRFINPDGNDHVSEYGSITTYIPRGLELIFSSYSRSQGGGSGTVQSVTALNPLAVNNSDPANPVLNVATPEVAQSYATTAENNAKSYAEGLVVGLLDDRGNYDASTNLFPSSGGSGTSGAVLKGDLWTVSVAGTLGGISVGIGDVVRALSNSPGQTSSNWVVTEHNFGYVAENQANKSDNGSLGTSTTLYPTQRAVKQYVDSTVGRKGFFAQHGTAALTADAKNYAHVRVNGDNPHGALGLTFTNGVPESGGVLDYIYLSDIGVPYVVPFKCKIDKIIVKTCKTTSNASAPMSLKFRVISDSASQINIQVISNETITDNITGANAENTKELTIATHNPIDAFGGIKFCVRVDNAQAQTFNWIRVIFLISEVV